MRTIRLAAFLALPLTLSSCIDTGADFFELPLSVQSTGNTSFAGRGDWTVTLTEARVAFGPIYLCAAARPGDTCETAIAEELEVLEIDLLNDTAQDLGVMVATPQPVRSYMAEYGRPWGYRDNGPRALASGVLGGHSLLIAGFAEDESGRRVDFSGELDFEGAAAGTVPVRADLDAPLELAEGTRIQFSVAPEELFVQLDFDTLHDADGALTQSVVLESGTQAYRALRLALVSNSFPIPTLLPNE